MTKQKVGCGTVWVSVGVGQYGCGSVCVCVSQCGCAVGQALPIVLSNLALYGGPDKQLEMTKQKGRLWVVVGVGQCGFGSVWVWVRVDVGQCVCGSVGVGQNGCGSVLVWVRVGVGVSGCGSELMWVWVSVDMGQSRCDVGQALLSPCPAWLCTGVPTTSWK